MKNINSLIGNLVFLICVICGSVSAQGITVDSNPFNITPSAPNNLVFVQPPTTTVSGSAFNPPVSVRIRDIYNNNTTASNQITLSVSAGATLGGGPTNVNASSGLATFTGVTVTLTTGISGTYTLTATSTGLTQTTAQFSIVAPPAQVGSPSPSTGATDVAITVAVSWATASGATSYNVYFGTNNPPTNINNGTNQTGLSYDPPGSLTNGTLHYWRIDSVNAGGTTTGIVWSFTTVLAQAGSPSPTTGATGVPINQQLSWGAVTGATSYGVYFGTTNPPPFVITNTGTTYNPGALAYSTQYYWRINSSNAGGTTTGIVWSFTTAAPVVVTFNYTAPGGVQPWQVPAGVFSITVDCSGAQGGGSSSGYYFGGNGARVQTTLSVTPGNTLYIYVGGLGADGYSSGGGGGAGGYNGGGRGGDATGYGGGGGGGGSDIRTTSGDLTTRIVVAGGGGGGGGNNGDGGAGGQTSNLFVGTAGAGLGGGPGLGGTNTAGGAGGGTIATGSPGSLGNGGNGGGSTSVNSGGGGGGGGYFGGGGGGGAYNASGGGGGSSNAYSGTSATYTTGYRAGAGQIIITY